MNWLKSLLLQLEKPSFSRSSVSSYRLVDLPLQELRRLQGPRQPRPGRRRQARAEGGAEEDRRGGGADGGRAAGEGGPAEGGLLQLEQEGLQPVHPAQREVREGGHREYQQGGGGQDLGGGGGVQQGLLGAVRRAAGQRAHHGADREGRGADPAARADQEGSGREGGAVQGALPPAPDRLRHQQGQELHGGGGQVPGVHAPQARLRQGERVRGPP